MPQGRGYGQFSRIHFFLLFLTAVLIAAFILVYQRSSDAFGLLLLRSVAATLIFIDVIKMIVIGLSDVKFSNYLPLELCSFAAYFIVLDSIPVGRSFVPEMLLTLFLPAAIMAILFPTTSTLPAFNFYTIHQFFYHGLIIAYVLARFVCGEIPMNYLHVWKSILIVLMLVACIYGIDRIFNKTFMFLTDPYGNPLLNIIWEKCGGGFAYTLGLVAFCILMIHVFYLLFLIPYLLFIR